MDRFTKLILKPKIIEEVLISDSDGDSYVIFDGEPTQKEMDYIYKNEVKNLILIDPKDFTILDILPEIYKLQIIYSYFGRKKKYIKVNFSPLYKHTLQELYLNVNPKVVFTDIYDCSKQVGLKKLQACVNHIRNLDKIETLESLELDFNNTNLDLSMLKNKINLKFLILRNGYTQDLKGLSECTSLISLTLRNVEIFDTTEIGMLFGLKNLFIASMIHDDISKSLQELSELEYLYLNYNGRLDNVFWLNKMYNLKVFIVYCKIINGDLKDCDQIPYTKLAIEYSHYNRKNNDLSKKIIGKSVSGIPSYESF